MSLPSPTLSVPTLTANQFYFQGVTFGANTPFEFTLLEGFDKPEVRSGNTSRPRARGAFVGLNLLGTRTVTFTLDIGPPFGAYTNLAGALAVLRTACATEGATEYPLWVQLPNTALMCCMARVTKRSTKFDVTANLGSLVKDAPLQFEATDPYLYTAPTAAPTVSLPTPGRGFSFPLTFNLSFGGASTGNQYTAVNLGNVPCWPVLVITGPCLNPIVQNQSITGGPFVSFNIQLNAGDQLVIDCDMQSVTYFTAGSAIGASRMSSLAAGSTFFAINPGSNILAFNSQDTTAVAGTLNPWFASAYDGAL